MPETTSFQVDLRGMVDILSNHLYSSPRVYLRELLQNATDALTARRDVEPGSTGGITVTPADVAQDGRLHVDDDGIGLDEAAIRTVLATIGGSTKRDELGFSRQDYLGQFGIGLLSCFVVSDEIEVTTRRVGDDATWRWVGRADGTYTVTPAQEPRDRPGTRVSITPRPGTADLVAVGAVLELTRDVAGFLDVDVAVVTPAGVQRPCGRRFPWERDDLTPAGQRVEAERLGAEVLGAPPLDQLELHDPATGVRGVGFVLPSASGTTATHRVYAKRMLVGDHIQGLLPSWAYFVRAVANADNLPLTASRESLHDDDTLAEVRERLGRQVRAWLLRMARRDVQKATAFFAVHALGVKAISLDDDEMLTIIAGLLLWQTSEGPMTLQAITDRVRRDGGVIEYVIRNDDYRAMLPFAQASGRFVVNAGYAYDADLLQRWLTVWPGLDSRRLEPSDLAADFQRLDGDNELRYGSLLELVRTTLERSGTYPMVRRFAPEAVQAVLLTDRSARFEADREALAEQAPAAWMAALDTLAEPEPQGPAFVLNAANPTVRRLAEVADRPVAALAVEVLYAQALIAGQHPLRPYDSAVVTRALPSLIDHALITTTGSDRA